MIGKNLGHYEVLAALGKGGMGEVYRARDTKLGREVALKILPAELSQDAGRRARFEREAQTVAALNHPNVVTLYAVEEAEGRSFLAMELVEGITLDQAIPAGGLPLARFLDLAESLCAAVAAAHAKGITHRDLKPQNVMIDDEGRVKVLDFGLAKILESAWQVGDATFEMTAHATREGAIVGTAAYMSPEQAEGKEVDARSDVFSLGVLLYEMLTGQRAFQGETQMSTLTAVLRDQPRAVMEIRPDLPRQLSRILRRCLEKDPDRRFESAKGLRYDLEILREELDSGEFEPGTTPAHSGSFPQAPTPSTAGAQTGTDSRASSASMDTPPSSASGDGTSVPAGPTAVAPGAARSRLPWIGGLVLLAVVVAFLVWSQRGDETTDEPISVATPAAPVDDVEPTIVVFPFQNLGPPEDEYFAAGITDEILTSLIQVEGLRVLSRTSAQNYDRTGKSMQEIADDLGVDYVLEGTVRWQKSDTGPSRVRVTPQLVAAHQDEQVWGERYDKNMEEIFTVQTEIAEEVVRQLGGALAIGFDESDQGAPTEDMEAYHAYLRAKAIVDGVRFAFEDWTLAGQLFERAVERDPEFHLAWAELAKLNAGMVHFGWDRGEERLSRSREAVDQAGRLVPDHPMTHLGRGYYYYWGLKDYAPALESFRAALAQRPKDPDLMLAIAYVHRRQGEYESARDLMLRAVELSPQDAALCYHIGETSSILGDYEAADRWARRGILLAPDDTASYAFAAWTAALEGNRERLTEVLASIPIHRDPEAWFKCFSSLYQYGDYSGAREYLEELPEVYEAQYYHYPRTLLEARLYAAMGRDDEARESFVAAERTLAEQRREHPERGNLVAAHALALAGIGECDRALESARESLGLFPASKDVWINSYRVLDLARVQIMCGQHDEAMETLVELMNTPTDAVSPALLRKSPDFDPLRDREDFEALVRAQS